MQITDILAQVGGLQSISRELGVSESEAQSGASALLPAILGGFKKQAQTQAGGAGGLEAMLGRLGGGELADDVLSPEPTHVERGNDVLGQIFGSKEVSRTVAQNAASQTGLQPDILKRMLPMLAMLVTGLMAKRSGGASGGGLGGMLGSVLGGQRDAGVPGVGTGAGGGLGSMLDLDGDGNPLDDIMRMAGKAFR
jgi:hypothetical protein